MPKKIEPPEIETEKIIFQTPPENEMDIDINEHEIGFFVFGLIIFIVVLVLCIIFKE